MRSRAQKTDLRIRACFFFVFLRNYKRKVTSFMEKRFHLRVEDVLNKQFHVDFKGYAAHEVDAFLDQVIEDYQEYDAMIKELGDHLREYEDQLASLKAKIVELEGKNSVQAPTSAAPSNVDIIKRLSRLEQAVFQNK